MATGRRRYPDRRAPLADVGTDGGRVVAACVPTRAGVAMSPAATMPRDAESAIPFAVAGSRPLPRDPLEWCRGPQAELPVPGTPAVRYKLVQQVPRDVGRDDVFRRARQAQFEPAIGGDLDAETVIPWYPALRGADGDDASVRAHPATRRSRDVQPRRVGARRANLPKWASFGFGYYSPTNLGHRAASHGLGDAHSIDSPAPRFSLFYAVP